MTLISKIGSILSAFIIVGGGVYAINHFYKGYRDLNQRLTGAGFKVLDVNLDSELKEIEMAYNKETNQNKKFDKSITTARNNCKITLQKNPIDPNNYKLASKWCVKPEKMEEILIRNKYKKLIKSAGEDQDKEKWKKKIEELKNYAGEEKIKIDFLKETIDNQIDLLQKECAKIINDKIMTYSEDDFEKKFIKAKLWCSER